MKYNIPFVAVLSGVWLILLALCALIGYIIVPVDSKVNSELIQFLISSGKVGLSLLAIGIWLFCWYKAMALLLHIEFYLSDKADFSSIDD